MSKRTSRSGYIRRFIAPALSTIAKQISTCESIKPFVVDSKASKESNLLAVKEFRIKNQFKVDALERTTERINNSIHEWKTLLDDLVDEEIFTEEQEIFETLMDQKRILELIQRAEEVLTECKSNLALADLVEKQWSDVKPQPVQGSLGLSNIRLPNIDHPRFNGRSEEWMRFYEYFTTTIGNNTSLSDVEKLTYLIGLLDGEAKNCTKGFLIRGNNYNPVFQLLKERFGNDEKISHKLLHKLNSIKITGMGIHTVKQFINEMNEAHQQLRQFGKEIGDHQFMIMIERKLPRYILEKLQDRKRTQQNWNSDVMIQEIYDIIGEQEMLRGRDYDQNLRNNRSQGYQRTLAVKQNPVNDNRPCIFCMQKNHDGLQCLKFKTSKDRKTRLMELHKCLRCLSDYDNNHKCQKLCTACGGTHHKIVCYHVVQSDNSVQFNSYRNNPAQNVFLHNNRQASAQTHRNSNRSSNFTPIAISRTFTVSEENNAKVNTVEETQTLSSISSRSSQLPVVFINLKNMINGMSVNIPALLDSGSEKSYLLKNVADDLNLQTLSVSELTTETFGGKFLTNKATTVEAVLNDTHIITFTTVPEIIGPTSITTLDNKVVERQEVIPSVLIGMDYLMDLLGFKGELIDKNIESFETRLGNILIDKQKTTSRTRTCITKISDEKMSDENEFDIVENLWSIEKLGLIENTTESIDGTILRNFEKNIELINGRYSVEWLFNGKEKDLQTNIGIAFYRLKSLKLRLDKDQDLMIKVQEIFSSQANEGIIERVTTSTTNTKNIVSYMPFQLVSKPDKATTKLRVVFDGSASSKNSLSINNVMFQGPLMLPQLLGLLIRFRFGKYVTISDIKSAFLQIQLKDTSRDIVRFLLPKDWSKAISNDNIQVWRFTRVCFGITCSPALLAMTLQHHLKQYHNGSKLLKNLYVDNMIEIHDEEDELINQCQETQHIFKEGSFELREYFSNSTKIMKIFNSNAEYTPSTKILGHEWNFAKDEISIVLPIFNDKSITKRSILAHIGSIYDPTGVLSPSVLPLKLLLHELWSEKYDWDTKLSDYYEKKWKNMVHNNQSKFTTLRFIAKVNTPVTLVLFCDASEKAFGVAAYAITYESTTPILILGKSRLLPKDKTKGKRLTIPRKELIAILCAVRVAKFLKTELLTISDITIFSDSQVALHQLNKNKDDSLFVRNRVQEINRSSSFIEFRYTPTNENPADIASRGISFTSLLETKEWWNGPKFLSKGKESWPQTLIIRKNEENSLQLENKSEPEKLITLTTTKVENAQKGLIINVNKWNKIIGIFRLFIRYANKHGKLQAFADTKRDAAILIVRNEQIKFPPSEEIKRKLNIFYDENFNVWRVKTRLSETHLTYDAQNPLWLSNDSPITYRIIQHYHDVDHQNAITVTSEMRMMYWITYRTVKSTVKGCLKCRIHNVKPFSRPLFAPLPTSRVLSGKPFDCIGTDVGGPIHTTSGPVYYLLFTCLKIRGIHLEMIQSFKTEDIMGAITKFIARRGTPSYILSDNASYFVLARKLLLDKSIYATEIEWHTITPRAPHEGGVYERLNTNIKESLKRTIRRKTITVQEFETLLISIEGSINNRPLLTMTDDPENHEILRPVDFIRPLTNEYQEIGKEVNLKDLQDPNFIITKSTAENLRKVYNSSLQKLNELWEKWSKCYLTMLRDHNKESSGIKRIPQIGELVLIEEKEKRRSDWKLARIKKLNPSKDGVIRTCDLIVPSRKVITRSVCQLCPLEVGGNLDGRELNYRTVEDEKIVEVRKQPNRKARQKTRERNLSSSSIISILTILSVMICYVNSQRPLLCHAQDKPIIWKYPVLSKCHTERFKQQETPFTKRIALYKRNTIEYASEGFFCRIDSSTVRQQTHLNGNIDIQETKNEPENLSEEECQKMISKKICKYGSLMQNKQTFHTNNIIKINPPNRFASLMGTKEDIKQNCILMETKVFGHYGKARAASTLGDVSECLYNKGTCQTGKNEVFIWRPNITQNCAYLKIYEGKALATSSTIMINDLHSMLTYDLKIKRKSCNKSLIHTHQGLAFEFLPEVIKINKNRNKRQIRASDEETADLQYLEHQTLQSIRQLAITLCTIINDNQLYLNQLMRREPTAFLRKLLNRDNIFAKRINDEVAEVIFCHPLKKEEYTFLPAPNNSCSIPIQLKDKNKRILYLRRDDHTLHRQPDTDNECGKSLIVSIEGNLYEYIRITGQLILGKINQNNTTATTTDDWDFLKNEFIYQDILLHEADELQESIIQELERNTESKTDVALLDQSVFKHRNIEDELWEYYWLYDYIKIIWIVWVTIICTLETYGAIKVVLDNCKGRYRLPLRNDSVPNSPQKETLTTTRNSGVIPATTIRYNRRSSLVTSILDVQ